ncbi:hypothetical protein Esti_006335 [Eimeria stiedai]
MDIWGRSGQPGCAPGDNTMRVYAGAIRRTTAKPTQFDHHGATATMQREKPVPPQNIPMQGFHRFLAVKGQSPMQFDRLRDLSLLSERDEAQAFPPLRREIALPLKITSATQETEPQSWHPRHPSTIAARELPPQQAFLGGDSLPLQRFSRLNPSETRIFAGETEQLTEPFVRVEGTSEKYRFYPASEELPLSGLWHTPVGFSDAGKGQTALKFREKKEKKKEEAEATPLASDPSGLPMARPKALSLPQGRVEAAPRACMQYAPEDIAVYPGGIPMDNVLDLQEKALFKVFEEPSKDTVVENLMLEAVRPGLKRGVAQQLQQPTEQQWMQHQEELRAERARRKKTQGKQGALKPKTDKTASPNLPKKVTFDMSSSSTGLPKDENQFGREGDENPNRMLQQLQQLHHMQLAQLESQEASTRASEKEGRAFSTAGVSSSEVAAEKSVNDLITRCALKLNTLKGTKAPQSAEPAPPNAVTAPKAMSRPARLLKAIEVAEAHRRERVGKPGSKQPEEGAAMLLLPQSSEQPVSSSISKSLQGLRALSERPKVRSPRSMPRAELVCLSRSLLPERPAWEEDDFITEEEAAENVHAKVKATVEQPSYEVFHGTPTPKEDLTNATPTLAELEQHFLPTTGYPHDTKRSNYPAAIPSWVSRLFKSENSKMAVPPAAAVLYAMPKEGGGGPAVEAMPTDPRSGASQTTEEALSKLSQQDIRNIEELVAGGFVALQRQTHSIDYRHKWEEEEVRLKMIFNEPVHAKEPYFLDRQNLLLSKWAYPAEQISPGYYVKEANLEEERQAILASKKKRSIFDLQKVLMEMRKQQQEEVKKRQQEEEKEVESRLREGDQVRSVMEASTSLQAKLKPEVFKEAEDKPPVLPPPPHPPPAPTSPSRVVEPPPKPVEEEPTAPSKQPSADTQQDPEVERLKKEYRRLRKQSKSPDIEKEMKSIKRQIAELTGRKKPKPYREVRRKAIRPVDEDGKIVKTAEETKEEERRERLKRLMKLQQGGAGALLASVLQGRGVEEEELEEEKEDEEETESSEVATTSSEETISSGSVSSYDSTEVPLFERSSFTALEYKPTQETVEAWRQLPVDYCGRVLLETGSASAEAGGNRPKSWARSMRVKRGASKKEPSSMLLLVEARGPALLLHVLPEPKVPKKKWTPAALCKKQTPPQTRRERPEAWEYLCSVLIDNTAEVVSVTREGAGGAPYKAINFSARIIHDKEPMTPEEQQKRDAQLTKQQKELREGNFFKGFLTGDTEAETEEWMAVLSGRKAFCRYLSACEEASIKPSRLVAASLWSPGPREVVLQGAPYRREVDEAIFTSLKLESFDAVYCGWRGINDTDLEEFLKHLSCHVRILDLSANKLGGVLLKQLAQLCHEKAISQLLLAENNFSETPEGADGIAQLMAAPEPVFLDLRRTAIDDQACAKVASELRRIERPGLVEKTINLGENDLTEGGLGVLAAAVAETIPRIKTISLPNIPAITADSLAALVKDHPPLRPTQLSAFQPFHPFACLDERQLPEQYFLLPAVFSGRLFTEDGNVGAPGESPSQGAAAGNGVSLAFFELRGNALMRYSPPSRLSVQTGQLIGQPTGVLPRAFEDRLEGIRLSLVKLTSGQLVVSGEKIKPQEADNENAQAVTWTLTAESDAYLLEWYRVITIRNAGVVCNTIAHSTKTPLHPGVGQYCTSCFRTHLDLGGRTLPLGQLMCLFSAVVQDFRLKTIDMSDMALQSEMLLQLPGSAFAKAQLALLDLSFNELAVNKEENELATFCGSAKECACLTLDSNPLGDNASAASFVMKLLEKPVSRLCLNCCGLGDTFAEALRKQLLAETKQLPFLTVLEMQSNCISSGRMQELLGALLPRCPSLTQIALYGNGFDSLEPFRRPVQVNFDKTHLDHPRKRVLFERRLTKKSKSPEQQNQSADKATEDKALPDIEANDTEGQALAWAALAATAAVLSADPVVGGFMVAGDKKGMEVVAKTKAPPPPQEICQTIPVQVDSMCFESVPFKEAYICPQVVERQVCEKVPVEVPDTCYKPTNAMEAYDCSKKEAKKEVKKEECKMIPKQCFKTVHEQEEYPCEEEQCETVVKKMPQTCFKKKTSKENYTCMKHKKQKVCHEVPQEYESTCFQEEPHQELVPCAGKQEELSAVSFEEKCTMVQQNVEATCEREVMLKEEYPCTKREIRRDCEVVPQKVTEMCEEMVEEQKPYKCKKKQIAQKCKMENVSMPATCERKKGDKMELYDCEKKMKREVCKDVEESVEAVCYQLVASKQQVPCKKKKMNEVCVDREVEVPSSCFREVPGKEPYPCMKPMDTPHCVKIAMCARFTTQKKAYPCVETKMKQECHVEEVPYEDTCTRQFTEEQPYDCSKEIKSKECKMVPKMCKRKVTKDVAFECSEKVCEKISVPTVCYRKVKGKEAYPCTRTEYKEQCHMHQQLMSKTCYSQGMKPQQYPCKETKYETVCKQVAQKAMVLTTQLVPVTPVKKEKEKKAKKKD